MQRQTQGRGLATSLILPKNKAKKAVSSIFTLFPPFFSLPPPTHPTLMMESGPTTVIVKFLHFFQNCINQFTATALSDRCSFFGNVNIGKDLKITELLQAYDAVVLVS